MLLAAVSVLTVFGPLADRTWEHPQLLFSLTTVAAAACVIGATIVIALADRREMAEIGLLGTALMAASVLPLVHGLVTPGVLYDQSEAFRTSAYLTLPVAVALGAPLLLPHSAFGRWAARRWRDWTLLSLMFVFVLASAIVFFPDADHMPSPTSAATIMVTAAMAGRSSCSRADSSATSSSAAAVRTWSRRSRCCSWPSPRCCRWCRPRTASGSGGSTSAGLLGVLGVCVGLAVSRWMSKSAQDILAPVLARNPLVAFELGLSPTVHQLRRRSRAEGPDDPRPRGAHR
jgi:hypothetical protein